MQFLTSLFGGFENSVVTVALALGIVLVLIVLTVWGLKVLSRTSGNLAQGRGRRLNVVDSVMLDPRRRIFIVRRDNVEHVILTGGPQDLLLESGILAEMPSALPRRPPLPSGLPSRTDIPAPGADAATARPAPPPPGDAMPSPSMERLRELARPKGRQPSLRHTGLLRPVSRMQPAPVIPINPGPAEHRRVDSAKALPSEDGSGQALGTNGYSADGAKAEGS